MPHLSPLRRTVALFFTSLLVGTAAFASEIPDNFKTENLIAWCIAHRWDSEQRPPAPRAEMLHDLGLHRFVYSWTKADNPDFEAEILAAKKHDLDYFAFWNEDESAFALFEQHGLHPQIWKTCPSPKADTPAEQLALAIKRMTPFAKRAQELGSKFGLYNHRGWGGHPENLVKVCQALHRLGYDNVGIVYNFHHSHDEMDNFAAYLALMQPYLLCLNLNGMADKETVDHKTLTNKILPIGSGKHEAAMIKTVLASDYDGPIGILGHTQNEDVAQVLRRNIEGLALLLNTL